MLLYTLSSRQRAKQVHNAMSEAQKLSGKDDIYYLRQLASLAA